MILGCLVGAVRPRRHSSHRGLRSGGFANHEFESGVMNNATNAAEPLQSRAVEATGR